MKSELTIDIRTYAVMPLNEECGLLEWVSNTNALKGILEKGYQRHGKRVYVSVLLTSEANSRRMTCIKSLKKLESKVTPPRLQLSETRSFQCKTGDEAIPLKSGTPLQFSLNGSF